MTRKDYVRIANAIAGTAANEETWSNGTEFGEGYERGREAVAVHLAHVLAQDNPRFDRDRFMKASGVTP